MAKGLFLLFMPVIFFCSTLAFSQGKPNFTNGGPFGGPVPAAPPNQAVTNQAHLDKTKDEAKPKVLGCDEQYEVDVTLTQEVKTCEGFNFKNLYEQAKEMADKEIAKIECPADEEDCVGPKTWYGFWHWGCLDPTHAQVVVQEVTTCVKAGSKVPAGYGDGSKQSKTKPVSLGGPPPTNPVESGEFITNNSTGTLDGWLLDCGTKLLVSYVYQVTTPDANALGALKTNPKATDYSKVKSFQPFYDQAVAKAKDYHNQFKCKTTPTAKCELLPFQVVSGDISVDGGNNLVIITLYFYVECKKA